MEDRNPNETVLATGWDDSTEPAGDDVYTIETYKQEYPEFIEEDVREWNKEEQKLAVRNLSRKKPRPRVKYVAVNYRPQKR